MTFFATASLDARINLGSSAVFWVNLSGFSSCFYSSRPLSFPVLLGIISFILAFFRFLSLCASFKRYLENARSTSFVDITNRNKTLRRETMAFLCFSVQVTSRSLYHSPRVYGNVRLHAHSLVRWRHNKIISAWWFTNLSYLWCFAGALRERKLPY